MKLGQGSSLNSGWEDVINHSPYNLFPVVINFCAAVADPRLVCSLPLAAPAGDGRTVGPLLLLQAPFPRSPLPLPSEWAVGRYPRSASDNRVDLSRGTKEGTGAPRQRRCSLAAGGSARWRETRDLGGRRRGNAAVGSGVELSGGTLAAPAQPRSGTLWAPSRLGRVVCPSLSGGAPSKRRRCIGGDWVWWQRCQSTCCSMAAWTLLASLGPTGPFWVRCVFAATFGWLLRRRWR
jgi:hypothetical protein